MFATKVNKMVTMQLRRKLNTQIGADKTNEPGNSVLLDEKYKKN